MEPAATEATLGLQALALGHVLLAAACAVWWLLPAPALLGVHPALKPLKFGVSIAVYLWTVSALLPRLDLSAGWQRAAALLLGGAMVIEMTVIMLQPFRGTTSHFNQGTALDRTLWAGMVAAIVAATLGMLALAAVATWRPMRDADGAPLDAMMATAWVLGLWLFQLAALSGFTMGGRLAHTVGAPDGGPGLPVVNWSTRHGDLRVSHFFALHAMQVLPLAAWVLARTVSTPALRWVLFSPVMAACVGIPAWTLLQALRGQPLLRTP
jgi:hypothetical protein